MNQGLFFVLVLSVFLSANLLLMYRYFNLKKEYASLIMTQINVIDRGIDKKDQEYHQESFIKFLSDSREMAFEYIDNSQKQIKDFIEVADKQFAFFDSYGMLTEGQLYYESMKILSDEYKKLKSLLPEDN